MTRRGPLLGALAIVIRRDSVLLVQRGKAPDLGLWGYPGGHVEFGETALEAAVRELQEETGVRATPVDYLTNVDLVGRDANGQVRIHYLLAAVLCDYQSGTPVAADDAMDAAWIPQKKVRDLALPMSDRVAPLLDLALQRCQASRPALRT